MPNHRDLIWPSPPKVVVQRRRNELYADNTEYEFNPLNSRLSEVKSQDRLKEQGFAVISILKQIKGSQDERRKDYIIIDSRDWDGLRGEKESQPHLLEEFPDFVRVYKRYYDTERVFYYIYQKDMNGRWLKIFASEVPQKIRLSG